MRKRIVSLFVAGVLAVSSLSMISGSTQAAPPDDTVISGTITVPGADGETDVLVSVCRLQSSNGGKYARNCSGVYADSGFAYSINVENGQDYVVYASVDDSSSPIGYLQTWFGGHVGYSYWEDLTDKPVTILTAPANGAELTASFTMVKASTISGKVLLPAGYSWAGTDPVDGNGRVGAYTLRTSDGDTYLDQGQVAEINDDGTYTIANLLPGQDYAICVKSGTLHTDPAAGVLSTCLGGYASQDTDIWQVDPAKLTMVSASASGGDVRAADLTLGRGSVITGTVSGPTNLSDVGVNACPVSQSDGDWQTQGSCVYAHPDSQGKYSLTVQNDKYYVVYALTSETGYLPTYVGGFATGSIYQGRDAGQATVTKLHAPDEGADLAGDIAMVRGTIISGKVTMPESTDQTYGWVSVCQVVTTNGNKSTSDCRLEAYLSSDGDGTYSITVPNGADYLVYADGYDGPPSGYMRTWHGGYASTTSADLADPDLQGVNILTAPAAGGTTLTANITLAKAASISGKVSLPEGYSWGDSTYGNVGTVSAYRLVTMSDTYSYLQPVQGATLYQGSDGAYTLTGLEPGQQYALCVTNNSYNLFTNPATGVLTTCLGGFSQAESYLRQVDPAKLTLVTAPTGGSDLPGQDFTLARGTVITGKVTGPPTDSLENVAVQACPVTQNAAGNWRQQGSCTSGYANSNGEYSITANNGATYVVHAQVEGYLPTYLGGYAISPNYVSESAAQEAVTKLPTPDNGATLTGKNIALVKGTVLSGTVTAPGLSASDTNAYAHVNACQLETREDGSKYETNCQSTYVYRNNGTGNTFAYSMTVMNDRDHVVYANVYSTSGPGYLYTYHGGYWTASVNSSADPSQSGVTSQHSPANGGTLKADITLAQAASISGKVTLPEGFSWVGGESSPYVYVYQVLTDGLQGWSYTYSDRVNTTDGSYKVSGLEPGKQFVVCIMSHYLAADFVIPENGLLMTCHGGFSTDRSSVYSSDLGSAGLDPATAPGAGRNLAGVDIDVKLGATISGTVYLPDGAPSSGGWVQLSQVTPDGFRYIEGASVDADGKYTFTIMPGTTYAVVAESYDDSPYTWHGGYLGSSPDLTDAGVTRLTASSAGQALTGKDIHLVEGSTISGKLNYVATEDGYADIQACRLKDDGSLTDCRSAWREEGYLEYATIEADGSYTISGLVPGAKHVVRGYATGYATTYHGGLVGEFPLPRDGATVVTTAASGGTVANIDVTLVKALTITGTVSPPELLGDYGVEVYLCPVYTQDGQRYYINDAGWSTNDLKPRDVESWCHFAYTRSYDDDVRTWTYSAEVTPNQQYVVIGIYDGEGLADAWYGGRVADSDVWRVDPDTLSLVPGSQVSTVTGAAGAKVENVNLVFGESATVTFDANGGTPATQTRSVLKGAAVPLPPAPTRVGYEFQGWFANPDGSGDQFTGGALSADRTVYAKWLQVATYQVAYDANQGTGTVSDNAAYNSGDSATAKANAFTRDGFTFAGWNTAADGTGTAYQSGDSITMDANVTLYAQWTANPVDPVDPVAPVVPPVVPPAPPVAPPVADVVITAANGAQVAGTGQPGATVTVVFPDGKTGSAVVGADGKWAMATPADTKSGDLQATQVTTAGTTTAPGKLQMLVVNQWSPKTVSGVAVPGSTVKVVFSDGSTKTVTTGADGTWSVETPAGATGEVNVSMNAGTGANHVTESAKGSLPKVPGPTGGTVMTGPGSYGVALALVLCGLMVGVMVARSRQRT